MESVREVMSVLLALGSNLGDKEQNIKTAYKKIEERIGRIVSFSAFYYSAPEGFESVHSFVNSVCEVHTFLDIHTVFSITRDIENEMGRGEKSGDGVYHDRVIDIDLVLAGDLVVDTPELIVPHPRMHERAFVIEPLLEIAPDALHPTLNKSMRQLKDELKKYT